MPKVQSLFDERTQALQRQRRGYCAPVTHPLYQEAQARLDERLADVKREFTARHEWDHVRTQTLRRHCEGLQPRGNPAHDLDNCSKLIIQEMDCHAPTGGARNDGSLQSYDLITSCLTLQDVNALQDELGAIYASLAQGGLFLGVLAGGQTLDELRACLMEAELAVTGGASPRTHPLPDLETMSRLLAATGFALPVADQERVILVYPDLKALMHDLRSHGCANALSERSRRFASRKIFDKAQDLYAAHFPSPTGGITATVDLIFLHGWRE